MNVKRVVLAYSGGLDTSIIIPWLRETYRCSVIAYLADVGQGAEIAPAVKKAKRIGAQHVVVENLRRRFVENFCFSALRAQAKYEDVYLLGTSLARPVIAEGLVRCARRFKADAVAHGATGKGNDQVRFELSVMALAPDLKIIAPWREWNIRSREDAVAYAKARGIPIPVTPKHPYSMDRNLWHLSHEGFDLEDPWTEPGEHVYLWTRSPQRAPARPFYLSLTFQRGIPVALNGRKMNGAALLEKLNAKAAAYGVGRVDLVENRLVGMKSRGIYESPGATVLYEAHRALESITVERDLLHEARRLSHRYAELVYYGQWFSPLREALDGFYEKMQRTVTGDVRIRLSAGRAEAVGVRSPFTLYREDLATFGRDEVYRQKDAEGFIRLFGLPLKVAAQAARRGKGPS